VEEEGDCGDDAYPQFNNTFTNAEEDDEDDAPDSSILVAYGEHMNSLNDKGLNLSLFSRDEKVQLDLLQTLSNLNAPMKAYEAIMQWTNRSVQGGHIFRNSAITTRKTLLSRVTKRLNRDCLTPQWETLYLPYSDITVKVAFFSAAAVFGNLSASPLLNIDKNYIFDGDWNPSGDPYAVPDGSVIGDINTGQSYIKTHRSLCKSSNAMLLACPFAIDKTVCDVGGAGRLPMEPITMQYGLMQHDVRKKHEAMRVLGYIHPLNVDIQPAEAGVRAGPQRSVGHLPMYKECTNAAWKVNEYHMQIDFILRRSGFLALQERGIKWNIKYRGKLYPTVLHPYVPFIIGDTEGHDSLCGHYKSRTSGVAQLCRACECPTMKSGWSKGRCFAKRKPSSINKLVHTKRFDVLQSKSQHMLINAFDNIQFGCHSDRGIFGACPGEILHLVLLGWFKYVVKSFFKQVGVTSVAGKKYSRLCQDIASQLGRQSDRDIPRTTCNDFSSAANIPGHEYAGILLIMLLAFETSRYGEIFDRARALAVQGGEKDKHPGNDLFIADWKLLLSSLLEWWAWMKQPQISRRHVKRSAYATSYLLRLMKTVAPRHEGMKNNTVKTHLVLHMADDIIDFGVPEIFNSAYAESAHIPIAKKTVRNTQKRNATYEIQAAHRYVENLTIAHGNRHVAAEEKQNCAFLGEGESPHRRPWIGKSFSISATPTGTPLCNWMHESIRNKANPAVAPALTMDPHVLQVLGDRLLPFVEDRILHCQTEYTCPEGVLYRAHPSFDKKPWYDHVLVNWEDVPIPGRILCIVNLHNLKPKAEIKYLIDNHDVEEPGLYIVMQSYDPVDTAFEKARKLETKELDMHVSPKKRRRKKKIKVEEKDPPIFKSYGLDLHSDGSQLPTLYIVSVDSIVGPTIVISDISREYGEQDPSVLTHPNRPYIFMSRRRCQWADNWTSFIDWQYEKTVLDGEGESTEEDD
jgi:hypothetical protein